MPAKIERIYTGGNGITTMTLLHPGNATARETATRARKHNAATDLLHRARRALDGPEIGCTERAGSSLLLSDGGDGCIGRRTSSLPKGETNMPANSAAKIQPERLRFRELILGNPNYFGTAPETELPPVVEWAAQTTYEELTCVGLQPG